MKKMLTLLLLMGITVGTIHALPLAGSFTPYGVANTQHGSDDARAGSALQNFLFAEAENATNDFWWSEAARPNELAKWLHHSGAIMTKPSPHVLILPVVQTPYKPHSSMEGSLSYSVVVSGPIETQFQGDPAEFTATLYGDVPPDPSYQWYYRNCMDPGTCGSNITAGTNSSTYMHTVGDPNGQMIGVVINENPAIFDEFYIIIIGLCC